jgi:demethylmenaquinone methyltransferase / 2-methoxy-6-polyprenyl-1,4-benzoquinol methylase
MTRADLDKQPGDVAAMFDALAPRYDMLNDVLSMGQVRTWRRRVARIVAAAHPGYVLDLAAGTGTSTWTFQANGTRAVACDFSLGMLRAGHPPHPVAGDALNLPFADNSFDVTTVSFGLRNVHDTTRALTEMLRVTRPGGGLVVCEFSHITIKPLNGLYREYLSRGLPAVARAIARNPVAYEYLSESITDWPDQAGLARTIETAGWRNVKWRDMSLGVVAVHVGQRPE